MELVISFSSSSTTSVLISSAKSPSSDVNVSLVLSSVVGTVSAVSVSPSLYPVTLKPSSSKPVSLYRFSSISTG